MGHTNTHTYKHSGTLVSAVLTSISYSYGNGQNSTITESKPLNRLRSNFAQLITSTRRTRDQKFVPIDRKAASR